MLEDQIKRLRIAHNMNQVELATKLNVSKQSDCNWENNNIMPSVDMLKKLCQTFPCSADLLLELAPTDRILLDTSHLTLAQAAHIKQLVDDFHLLNDRLETP